MSQVRTGQRPVRIAVPVHRVVQPANRSVSTAVLSESLDSAVSVHDPVEPAFAPVHDLVLLQGARAMNKPSLYDSPLLDGSGNPVIDAYSSPRRPVRKAKRASKYLPHAGAKETARKSKTTKETSR